MPAILLRSSPQRSDEESRQKLAQLREQIENGQTAGLVRYLMMYQQCGAAIWLTSPGTMVPQFEQEMAKLQPNQISPPFKTLRLAPRPGAGWPPGFRRPKWNAPESVKR